MKKRGLVIGKFYPPHNGHHYLIDVACAETDEVDVLVTDSPKYRISANVRKQWLERRHPNARVQIIVDIGQDDDSKAWAEHTIKYLGYSPDVVFSSEDYGDTYARLMQSEHRKVDRERVHVPICATKIREDVLAQWHYLQPHVRAQFARRICLLGAESTGTTTLTKALAEHYHAPWVPEYGRYFTEALVHADHTWQSDEFVFIAREQQHFEDELAGLSNGLLFCDTNAFATRLWHERYMGHMSPAVDAVAAEGKADLYIITGDEIPFIQDGIRDGEHIRHAMHKRFTQEVAASGVPHIVVRGSVDERVAAAIPYIEILLKEKVVI